MRGCEDLISWIFPDSTLTAGWPYESFRPASSSPEGPGAVRAVLAGRFDNPVDDLRRQRDLQPTIGEVRVQLIDEQCHDPAQVVVVQRVEHDDLVDAVYELG